MKHSLVKQEEYESPKGNYTYQLPNAFYEIRDKMLISQKKIKRRMLNTRAARQMMDWELAIFNISE